MPTELLDEDYDGFTFAHSAATTARTFLLLQSKAVMPMNTVAANADNVFVYRCPMIRVPKATGETWAPLQPIYWDDTNKVFTTTLTGNTLAGYVYEAALSADAEGIIDLDPAA